MEYWRYASRAVSNLTCHQLKYYRCRQILTKAVSAPLSLEEYGLMTAVVAIKLIAIAKAANSKD